MEIEIGTPLGFRPWTTPHAGAACSWRASLHHFAAVLMFNASKLRIESLNIQEPKIGYAYKVDKWVRRVVRSGEYAIRM
eukprot:429718-Pelagomonas_calceolata.AAC.8